MTKIIEEQAEEYVKDNFVFTVSTERSALQIGDFHETLRKFLKAAFLAGAAARDAEIEAVALEAWDAAYDNEELICPVGTFEDWWARRKGEKW